VITPIVIGCGNSWDMLGNVQNETQMGVAVMVKIPAHSKVILVTSSGCKEGCIRNIVDYGVSIRHD
jgi:hypothetical protein